MIKKFSYQQVGKILTNILIKYKQNKIIFSIPYLHYVRQHPKFSFIYPEVFSKSDVKDNSYNLYKKIIKNIRLIFESRDNNRIEFLKNKKVVVISNLININDYKKNYSHYTNDLLEILAQKKISTLTVFRNFTEKSPSYFELSDDKINLPRINYIYWEFNKLTKIFLEKFKINLKYKFKSCDYNHLYFLRKSTRLINIFGALSSLRISFQIRKIVHQVKPKVIFIPIEGHAWEKVLIRDLKDEFSNLKIIGIHFSSIIKNDITLKQNFGKKFQPHYLICNKYLNYKIMKKYNYFKNSELIYDNLKIKQNLKIKKKISFKKIKCLVTPELNFSEVILFLDLIKKIVKKDSTIIFTLKLHPSTSNEQTFKIKKLLNKNTVLCKSKSISKEYNKNNIIIYRGSTTCFDAMQNGLWVMYYNKDNFNINPLERLNLKLNNFSNEIEFLKMIEKIKKLKHKQSSKYFSQINNTNFLKKINFKEKQI